MFGGLVGGALLMAAAGVTRGFTGRTGFEVVAAERSSNSGLWFERLLSLLAFVRTAGTKFKHLLNFKLLEKIRILITHI